MPMPTIKPIAIAAGDPSGVGPEILVRWARGIDDKQRFRLYGPPALLRETSLPGWACGGEALPLSDGKPTVEGARAAWAAMEAAAVACLAGEARAVVTGPVCKATLSEAGFGFPGQTEFFAAKWGGEPTMGFVGETLRVVLATWHLPLRAAVEAIIARPELLERAVERAGALAKRLGTPEPRIAVCGLNPHAGEGGLMGREEVDHLDPALDRLRRIWPGLSRCLPGDTVFHRALRGEFDAVVALYHDQGLAPLKTVEFHTAVNVSLGLTFVRTSPDHGTAFDIAGRGLADPGSFTRATDLADRLSRP
ncbi:MAG: 4-hydroxythreonine-4-phosphate dehydrogenase PdxA [Opitutales bacterium]|nr:4-hydroxythreonine-4-phosphate dehydrogenase PdxA [Opitutales bacterium]